MDILITYFRLAERTASEVYSADLARLLSDGFNRVGVLASKHGRLADELASEGVTVVQHPSELPFRPDVIHGHCNLETMIALMSFPTTPAVYLCHSHLQRREQPPMHPRIKRYLALNARIGQWLLNQLGLAQEEVQIVPGYVDFERFGDPRRVPERPAKALVYDRTTCPGKHLDILENACICSGVELDIVGDLIGKVPTRPEILLPKYDVVFASGRSAMEALAAGCGVITTSGGRFGELVTRDNLGEMQDRNFCVDDFPDCPEQTVKRLAAEFQTWDWRKLAPVADRLRQEVDPRTVRIAHERIYRAAIRDHQLNPLSPEHEFPAVAEWLVGMADQHQKLDSGYLEIQSRITRDQKTRKATERRQENLNQQLQTEREKVRAARRALFEGGNIATRGLRKRLEGEWRDIQKEHGSDEILTAGLPPEPDNDDDTTDPDDDPNKGVELSG
ncbi:MAG: hypothetical protein ACI8UO_000686 [Verrucomicrobiales bacterium]|jgi:hypothetical protein